MIRSGVTISVVADAEFVARASGCDDEKILRQVYGPVAASIVGEFLRRSGRHG